MYVFCQECQTEIPTHNQWTVPPAPASWVVSGMQGLTAVSQALQISQGLVNTHKLTTTRQLSESSAQWKFREGESWNLADTARAHLAEFIYCTELWRLLGRAGNARGRSRQTDRDMGEWRVNTPRKWSVPLTAHSPPGGNCHKLKCGQFCEDNNFIE